MAAVPCHEVETAFRRDLIGHPTRRLTDREGLPSRGLSHFTSHERTLLHNLLNSLDPGEGYLGKAGRLGQARHQAEEIILAELILLDPERSQKRSIPNVR